MKHLALIFILLLISSCKDAHPDSNNAELEAAAAKGREMGAAAAALPHNSMEQQAAILEIRSRESAIRDAGYPSCADTFAVEAEKELMKQWSKD